MKVLIVVDYQVDFVKGSLGFKGAEKLDSLILDKVKSRLKNGYVIFTKDTHFNDYLKTIEGKNLPIKHCIKGTSGHNLYGKVGEYAQQQASKDRIPKRISLKPIYSNAENIKLINWLPLINEDNMRITKKDEGKLFIHNYHNMFFVEKNTFPSAYLSTILAEINKIEDITEVEIVGVVTNICVISNAVIVKSVLPNAKIKIIKNMCASNDNKLEQSAYEVMKNLHIEIV